MDIEISGEYERHGYFRAIAWIFRPSRRDLLLRIGAFVLFGGLYALTVLHSLQDDGQTTFENARLARHLITFAFLGYIVVQPYLTAYRAAASLWRDPLVRRRITGRVNNVGVTIDPMKDPLTWDQFIKINNAPDMTVLLTTTRTFVLLPRAFFKDQRDWDTFQRIAGSRVQQVIE
jgi:hypothetical protein